MEKNDLTNIFYGKINILEGTVLELEKQKNTAYKERNLLVSLLSKIYPSYLCKDKSEFVVKEWENIVFIILPTGQTSWHIHEDELNMFNHLEYKDNDWDGHNNELKYERILNVSN